MTQDEPVVRLTRAQVREIDRRSIEEYEIPGVVLMENAAREVALRVCESVDATSSDPVYVFCGPGNNGGDGLAVARHVHNRRIPVEIVLAVDPRDYRGAAAANWKIAQRMKLAVRETVPTTAGTESTVYVDALFGTGLTRAPTGRAAEMIEYINREAHTYVIAVDVPSGLDCDTGEPLEPCVRATETVTFIAEKAGFANPRAAQFTGAVVVCDIGCPRELIDLVRNELT